MTAVLSPGPYESDSLAYEITVVDCGVCNANLLAGPVVLGLDGQLNFTIASEARGTYQFEVALVDDGGSENCALPAPGCNSTTSALVSIVVESPTDPPTFSINASSMSVEEDSGPFYRELFLTVINAFLDSAEYVLFLFGLWFRSCLLSEAIRHFTLFEVS